MQSDAYREMAAQQTTHWWYRGRRAVLRALIKRIVKPGAHIRILEAGCGTGANLPMLCGIGNVTGIEPSEQARHHAAEQSTAVLLPDSLPLGRSLPGGPFDLVCLFDVLEHLDEDETALRSLRAQLAANGLLLLTVPAHGWLWSQHDERLHHRRRYGHAEMLSVCRRAGLEPVKSGYFNSLLFPVALLQRFASRLSKKGQAGVKQPNRWLNEALFRLFALERFLVGRLPLPVGLSLFAVLRASETQR